MGLLTLADFRDELRFVCGGISATSPAWPVARLDRRINASYLWCSMPNHYKHPELEVTEYLTLTANIAAYAPINTFYMLHSVSHVEQTLGTLTITGRRNKLDPVDMRDQATIERTAQVPRLYSYWNNNIMLTCVPDAASIGQVLEVRGYQQPGTMTAVGEVTLLKAEWDEVIVVGAEWRMWISLNEQDRAYEAKQNLGALVNEIADVQRLHAEEWGWQAGMNNPQHMRSG